MVPLNGPIDTRTKGCAGSDFVLQPDGTDALSG